MKKLNTESIRKVFEKGFSYAMGAAIEGGANGNAETKEVYAIKAATKIDFEFEGLRYECKYNEGNRFTLDHAAEVDYFLLSCADNKTVKKLFEGGFKGLFAAYINRLKVYIVPSVDLVNSGFLMKAGKDKNGVQLYRIGYKVSAKDNTPKAAYLDFLKGYETL